MQGRENDTKKLLVVNEYANLLPTIKDGQRALKQAIINIYGYSDDDPYLSSKVANVKKRVLRMSVARILESAGIDKVTVATKLKELMDAEAPLVYKGRISKDKEGNEVKIPDLKTRMAATTLVANIFGLIQKGNVVDIHKRTTNNLIVMVEDEHSARKRVDADQKEQEILTKNYRVESPLERDDSVE